VRADTDGRLLAVSLPCLGHANDRTAFHLEHGKTFATCGRSRLAEIPAVNRIITTLAFYRLG
jgi:hypothetical protein